MKQAASLSSPAPGCGVRFGAFFAPRRIGAALAAILVSAAPAGAIVGAAQEDRALREMLVMLLIRGDGKAGFCSGVVLSRRVILTAAHCIKPAHDMRVFYRDPQGAAVVAEVAATTVSPAYRADAVVRRVPSVDLALVETATPLADWLSPVEPDLSAPPAPGETIRIAGFGEAREGDQKSAGRLRSASLTVREPVSKILLWAGDLDGNGNGACLGDSGGAALSASGGLVAIIAWAAGSAGAHCGGLTQSILLAPQAGWIRKAMEGWSN